MRLARLQLWIGLLLWMSTAALYLPTVRHDFVPFDDQLYVYANPWLPAGLTWVGFVHTFTKPNGDWTPLTTLSYSANYHLHGLWPGGYLLTNLLLHATATLLLFLALARLTGSTGRSAFVAAIFGFHPLHVESVAWISERKDVLSAVFFMGVLWSYGRYVEQRNSKRYAWVLGLFILGLLSKPMLATLPFVLLLLDVWPLGRVPLDRWGSALRSLGPLWVEKVPLFLLSLGACYATYLAQKQFGAVAPLDALPLGQRLLNVPMAYRWYLAKNLWPSGLAFYYPLDPTHLTGARVAFATAVLAVLSCGAFLARRRATYLAVGWLWFLGMLVPVIGLVQIGRQAWADRYTYLPLVGIEIALVWGASDLARRLRIPKAPQLAGAAAACAALLVVTHRQIATWQNGVTLAQNAIDAGFESVTAHLVAAFTYFDQGLISETRLHINAALRIDPNFDTGPRVLLAQLREKEGDLSGAAAEYERILQRNPSIELVRLSLSSTLTKLGRYDEALAVLADPHNWEGARSERELQIGHALAGKGDVGGAIPHYRTALLMSPGLEEAHLNLGRALTRLGQLREGEDEIRLALNLAPHDPDAEGFLADNLQLQGRLSDAVASWRAAIRLRPDWLEAKNNLAWVLATAGDPAVRRPDEAIALAEAMVKGGAGDDPSVLDTLAAAYAAASRRHDAISTARRALAFATRAGRAELSASIEDHLRHYEAGGEPPVTPAGTTQAD